MIAQMRGGITARILPALSSPLACHPCMVASTRTLSSSNGKKSTTSRDNRLAGRLRFYKKVGVEAVDAPWESAVGNAAAKGRDDQQEKNVSSPISAGVDGTDSASGIIRPSPTEDSSTFKYMLSPRAPGSPTPSPPDDISWYGVTLDGRILKTPMGQTLAVPSEMLAHMIAAEWNAQEKYLQPVNMPLMILACTALDQAASQPAVYRSESLRFLPTDTTCFWADPTEDRVLYRRQEEAWKDLHKFVENRLDHAPAFAMGTNEAMLMARKRGSSKPSAGLPHPPNLFDQLSEWTHSLDAWHLVALSSMCAQAKSFLVAWATMEPESPLADLQKAIEATRVEEEFQIANWGLVEGGHDYDRLNCSIQLYSATVFVKTIEIDNNLR